MTGRIAIVGTGPTGIYTAAHLLAAPGSLDLTLFEQAEEAGWGMPYDPDRNGPGMLANIASIEIPPVGGMTLVDWLSGQDDAALSALGVERAAIDPRTFFPRVVLGAYFRDGLARVVAGGIARGHRVAVRPLHRLEDVELRADDVLLTLRGPDGETLREGFAHAVLATGHTFPDWTETRPGYFVSPYPTAALRGLTNRHVGIRGTSLSAIDAAVAVAQANGTFLRDAAGRLDFHPLPGADRFRLSLMSRKGLLPEADFFFPIPYEPCTHCTPEAVDALCAAGPTGLLEAVFDLFRAEIVAADPDWAGRTGLALLDADGFARAYFAEREAADPWTWAARNLEESAADYARARVVPWRYAILRTHETVARMVPHLAPEDLERFHRGWKAVFVDNYATVPHESIERLLALHRAGRIEVIRLGRDHRIDTAPEGGGAVLHLNGEETRFDAFVEATGQRALDAADIPFPGLLAQGAIRRPRLPDRAVGWDEDELPPLREVPGVELDEAFRPVNALGLSDGLYCLALPFLLHRHPFHQGITSAEEMAATVARAILGADEGAAAAARSAVLLAS